jgi:lysophospholipase L1-like esterase
MRPLSMIRRLVCVGFIFVTPLGRSSGETTLAATQRRPTPIVYVALGDGYTTGDDGSGPVAASYPALLARHFPKGSRYRNLASDDNVVSSALYIDLPAAVASHPTLVTVWFGAVDLTYGGNTIPALFGKDLDTLLTALQRTHARVFVANMPDFRLFKDPASMPHVKNGLAYNAIIAAEARRHGAVVIDVYAATKTVWGHPDMLGGYSIPRAKGQIVLAALFYGVMHSHGAL